MLYARGAFANYAQKYAAEGDTRIAQQSTGRKTVKPNFVVDDAMVADFREQLKTDASRSTKTAFTKDIDFIKAMIRFGSTKAVFGIAEARRHLIGVDPQAQAALAMFGEAQKLRRAQPRREDESAVSVTETVAIGWGKRPPSIGGAVCACPNS